MGMEVVEAVLTFLEEPSKLSVAYEWLIVLCQALKVQLRGS